MNSATEAKKDSSPAGPRDDVSDAAEEFQAAWANPAHTRFELPSVDVNQTLASVDGARPSLRMTGLTLWDAELRKAWDPATYIPGVVHSGRSWGRRQLTSGNEIFWRVSEQRGWMTGETMRVIEYTAVDHRARRILFFGRRAAIDERGDRIEASRAQPLFFVEHSVQGTDDAPRIGWRMVHLTERRDDRLLERLERILMVRQRPEYVDIYLRRDLGVEPPPSLAASPIQETA